MSTIRFSALKETFNRKPIKIIEKERRSVLFGQNVFNKYAMQQYLTRAAYESVMNAIDKGTKIDRKIADQVAVSMKDWAISKGATHYTHWMHLVFQMEALEIRLKQEVTQLGIQHRQLLCMKQLYVFQQFLWHIQVKL